MLIISGTIPPSILASCLKPYWTPKFPIHEDVPKIPGYKDGEKSCHLNCVRSWMWTRILMVLSSLAASAPDSIQFAQDMEEVRSRSCLLLSPHCDGNDQIVRRIRTGCCIRVYPGLLANFIELSPEATHSLTRLDVMLSYSKLSERITVLSFFLSFVVDLLKWNAWIGRT